MRTNPFRWPSMLRTACYLLGAASPGSITSITVTGANLQPRARTLDLLSHRMAEEYGLSAVATAGPDSLTVRLVKLPLARAGQPHE